jgi:hypothetical protein
VAFHTQAIHLHLAEQDSRAIAKRHLSALRGVLKKWCGCADPLEKGVSLLALELVEYPSAKL